MNYFRLLQSLVTVSLALILMSGTVVEAGNCRRLKCRLHLYQRLGAPKKPCFSKEVVMASLSGLADRDTDFADNTEPYWGADSPCETAEGSTADDFWVTQMFDIYLYRAHPEQIQYDMVEPDPAHPPSPRLPHYLARTFTGEWSNYKGQGYLGDCVKEQSGVKC